MECIKLSLTTCPFASPKPINHTIPAAFTHKLFNPSTFSARAHKTAEISSPNEASDSPQDAHLVSGKSRGEIFLQKALQISRPTSTEPKETHKARKKKVKAPVKSTEPVCYGCGAVLQTVDSEAPGYVALDIFVTKKKHHQLNTVLCGRCRSLAHGQMIPAVGGHGGYGREKRFVSAEQLRIQLSHLRNEKALIIKLVDIIDFNGSFLTHIRDLVGANPIILVATKIDLLPRGTNLDAVGDWIVEFINRKKLNVVSVHMTSAKSLQGISGVVSYLQQHRQGRDVYILGSANVGKSAFVSAVLQQLARRDPFATAALKRMPIQSAMPGTTLGPIEIEAFSGGGSLFDTPGIHLHHRMTAAVSPEDLSLLGPRRRIRGYPIFPLMPKMGSKMPLAFEIGERFGTSSQAEDDEISDYDSYSENESNSYDKIKGLSLTGVSIFWGGIVRLDVVKAPPHVGLRFYGPNAVPVYVVPSLEADSLYKEELGRGLRPPTDAKDWPGLESKQTLKFMMESWNRPACDIAISGLGWATIEPDHTSYNENPEEEATVDLKTEVQMVIQVPKATEVFIRASMPVGFHGSEWYDYRELTEKELQARPRVFLVLDLQNSFS